MNENTPRETWNVIKQKERRGEIWEPTEAADKAGKKGDTKIDAKPSSGDMASRSSYTIHP